MSIKQWKSHSLMQNGALFLHIHESVQASQNTENLTCTSPENNVTAALTGSKYTKNPMNTSTENNIVPPTNTENLTGTSLENNIKGRVNREQVLTKAYGV